MDTQEDLTPVIENLMRCVILLSQPLIFNEDEGTITFQKENVFTIMNVLSEIIDLEVESEEEYERLLSNAI